MFWKLRRSEFEQQKGEANRREQKAIVDSGKIPGILAYSNGEPVGWCAVEPRVNYSLLERSRILKPLDDQPVWSMTCFYVAKAYRHKGLTVELLHAAVEHVARQGGKIVEGYPTEPRAGSLPDAFVYTGLASAFREAGFVEVTRRSETRPIFRYYINT
jgi:GNAT superfamily N-acetyltransferase